MLLVLAGPPARIFWSVQQEQAEKWTLFCQPLFPSSMVFACSDFNVQTVSTFLPVSEVTPLPVIHFPLRVPFYINGCATCQKILLSMPYLPPVPAQMYNDGFLRPGTFPDFQPEPPAVSVRCIEKYSTTTTLETFVPYLLYEERCVMVIVVFPSLVLAMQTSLPPSCIPSGAHPGGGDVQGASSAWTHWERPLFHKLSYFIRVVDFQSTLLFVVKAACLTPLCSKQHTDTGSSWYSLYVHKLRSWRNKFLLVDCNCKTQVLFTIVCHYYLLRVDMLFLL